MRSGASCTERTGALLGDGGLACLGLRQRCLAGANRKGNVIDTETLLDAAKQLRDTLRDDPDRRGGMRRARVASRLRGLRPAVRGGPRIASSDPAWRS
jgi:hypothetical protein